MKTILSILLLTVSVGFAHAQDVVQVAQPIVEPAVVVPSVVYQAPVVYTAPVLYQAPVTYTAPVYYVASAAAAAVASYATPAVYPAAACAPAVGPVCPPALLCPPAREDCAPRSEVVYIGGGHVSRQYSRNTCSSTVTFIGGSR